MSVTDSGRVLWRAILAIVSILSLLAASPAPAQIVATPVPGDPVSIDTGAVSGKATERKAGVSHTVGPLTPARSPPTSTV